MKSKNVQRGISQLRKLESAGHTPPGVGRLAKIHRSYEKRVRRQHSQETPSSNIFQEYLNYVLVIAGLLLVGGILWMAYSQMTRKPQIAKQHSLTPETFEVPHPSKLECLQMVDNFLNASTAEELKELVHLTRVSANDSFNLVSAKKKELGDVVSMEWGGADENNGLSIERVYLTLKAEQFHTVFLRPDSAGRWHVDLDSFLLHATKPWAEVFGKKSCTAVIRAMISSDYYYNGLFADENEWICISMVPTGQQTKLYGYIHPDTPNFRAIVEILKTENPAAAMMEISRDVGMEPLQYEIRSVVAQGWVESDKNFSQNFQATPKTKDAKTKDAKIRLPR